LFTRISILKLVDNSFDTNEAIDSKRNLVIKASKMLHHGGVMFVPGPLKRGMDDLKKSLDLSASGHNH
jgi:hypothetical protein